MAYKTIINIKEMSKIKRRYTLMLPEGVDRELAMESIGYEAMTYSRGHIKKADRGRYHITHEGGDYNNIHFDVDTVGGRHMTLPSTHTLQVEYDRVAPIWEKISSEYRAKEKAKKEKVKVVAKKKVKDKIKSETLELSREEWENNYKKLNELNNKLEESTIYGSILKLWKKILQLKRKSI